MNGLPSSDGGYDMGIEIGKEGIGKGDDIGSYSFTLDSTARDLTLADFTGVDFGVRLTSVGVLGGDRSGSSKLGVISGNVDKMPTAVNDTITTQETVF